MANVEKVIMGLKCCKEGADYTDPICSECPYSDEYAADCVPMLAADALALLKAQEPRVMTKEELDALGDKAIVWLECLYIVDGMKTTTLQPAIYQSENSSPEEDGYYCVVSSWSHSGFYHKDNYGGDWRCWTSSPDEKRRAETPWE